MTALDHRRPVPVTEPFATDAVGEHRLDLVEIGPPLGGSRIGREGVRDLDEVADRLADLRRACG